MLAADLLENEVTDKIPSDMETLQTAFVRLQQLLDRAYQYVDDVVVRHCSCLLLPARNVFDTAYVEGSDLLLPTLHILHLRHLAAAPLTRLCGPASLWPYSLHILHLLVAPHASAGWKAERGCVCWPVPG